MKVDSGKNLLKLALKIAEKCRKASDEAIDCIFDCDLDREEAKRYLEELVIEIICGE
jgi:hypothetical protein